MRSSSWLIRQRFSKGTGFRSTPDVLRHTRWFLPVAASEPMLAAMNLNLLEAVNLNA
jgi:hypothetical protein